MKHLSFHRLVPASLLILGLAVSTSCASTYKNSTGLKEVDGLVSRVESVHVEGELAMVAVRDSVTAMLELVAPQGQTTVHEAFESFEQAIAASVDQHESFEGAIEGLQGSAKPFFEGWSSGLESFSSQGIRIQSRKRMDQTRTSYDKIVLSSVTPLTRYAEFNTSLQDVALFLSRDFNSASVRMIEGELRSLIQIAGELDDDFAKCLEKCNNYSEESGLPTRITVEELNPEGSRKADKK
ncbi:MAG: DUF2959 family protein [Planctomycetes bacterium]|nr:DUF2959 family protein [Planctomycetota bacterium]